MAQSKKSTTAREARIELISKIEALRKSRLLCYVMSDRVNAGAQMGGDAVRPMYDHVRAMGKQERIDIFLYSMGGEIEVPWRIITMLREYASEVNVLIPYHAHSAATLMALGCNKMVLGKKAELGPIDPSRDIVNQNGGTAVQEKIAVEDIMAYVAFLKEKAGLGDQQALSENIRILSEKLQPWHLGAMYRVHSHIRSVAQKMLDCQVERLDEQKARVIIDALAEKTYQHGHAIGRKEAELMGLPVEKPSDELEVLLWDLLMSYETLTEMRNPVDTESALPPTVDETVVPITMAVIESKDVSHVFRGGLEFRRVRQTPPQVALNLSLSLNLPPNINPQAVNPQAMTQLLQALQAQMQAQIGQMIGDQLRLQSPAVAINGRLIGARWDDVTAEGL